MTPDTIPSDLASELIRMLSSFTDPTMVAKLLDSELEQLGRAAWAVTRRTQVEAWRRELERHTNGNPSSF